MSIFSFDTLPKGTNYRILKGHGLTHRTHKINLNI